MPERRRRAHARLSILTGLALLLAIFACRPAWSPDGKQLLFPTTVGNARMGVGLYDRAAGTARLLLPPRENMKCVAMAWTGDGTTAVILATADQESMQVHLLPLANPQERRSLPIVIKENAFEACVVPPVVLGHHLFVSHQGILRIDLVDGSTKRRPPAEGRSLIVCERGDGLGYVRMGKGDHAVEWELGTVDPDTLELTPLFSAPSDKWQVTPMPAFSPDLHRTALRAQTTSEDEQAILVFAGGKLESVLPFDNETELGFSNLAWAKDGVTILVSGCRRAGADQPYRWTLLELAISDSVRRETTVLLSAATEKQQRDNEAPYLMFPFALSPDGKIAAFSTAMIEGLEVSARGLYLVDLSDRERGVTRVPFPDEE